MTVPGRPPVTPTVDWSPVAPLASPHGCIVYITGDTAGTGHGLEPAALDRLLGGRIRRVQWKLSDDLEVAA